MEHRENFGSFAKENGRLVKEWFDEKLELYKLITARTTAKVAGMIIWTIVSLLVGFLVIVFIGLTAGFWLSTITGSYITGFGIVTLFLLLFLLTLAAFRKSIFINPIIRAIINRTAEEEDEQHKK